ncbi:VrrA/YqfQ family protein [Bacillus sp. 2205SS5-2]|uniref:VrrA/YqfQ family protein n=1 Tax=Bacillus sp. 2205SS5-2 TaxID=3109031 RepID=UPI003007F10E
MLQRLTSLLSKKSENVQSGGPGHPFSLHGKPERRTTQLNNEPRRDPFGFFPIRNTENGKEAKAEVKSEKANERGSVDYSRTDGDTSTLQEWMKVAESAAPLIEQYGPMVKKIPAMLSSFKKTK